jgi:hypothetical protein
VSNSDKKKVKKDQRVNPMPESKFEQLKIISEAKDLLYYNKKRGETYSDVIIRVFSEWKKLKEKEGKEK